MGLNDGYGHVISQILLIEPLPSLSKVCSLILQEDKRRNIGQSFNMIQSGDAAAMYVNNSRAFLGHQGQKNGGKGANGKKDRPVCTYCGFIGHIVDKCYKLHGYPHGYKPKGGNKAMANQVASMQTTRSCGFDQNVHSSFPPGDVHSGLLPGGALQGASVQSDLASQNHVGHSGGGSFVQASPQLLLSQAQCEQFLNFMKCHMTAGSGNDAQIGHQATFVMTSYPSIPHLLPSTSSSPSTLSNFSGKSFWIPPNLSHSIFAAQAGDRQAYKSNTWIIDTGATDHMVHSIA